MINILFSNVDRKRGINNEQAKVIKKDLHNNSRIIFISSLFDDYERNDSQVSEFIKCFKDVGITFSSSIIIDDRTDKALIESIMNNSDIIFLMGGSPVLQMKKIKEYGIDKHILNCPIVIGTSAGSMNQSKHVIYKDETEDDQIVRYDGLNLVDINIYPHLDWESKDYLNEVLEICKLIPLILLSNESFIRIENGKIEYFGEYYNIDKMTKDNKILLKEI